MTFQIVDYLSILPQTDYGKYLGVLLNARKVISYLIGLHRSPLATGYQRIKSAASLCIVVRCL